VKTLPVSCGLIQCALNLTPAVNFTNIIRAAFAPIFFSAKNYKAKHSTFSYKKAVHEMLVKFTTDVKRR
jgi:hypothetical protein